MVISQLRLHLNKSYIYDEPVNIANPQKLDRGKNSSVRRKTGLQKINDKIPLWSWYLGLPVSNCFVRD